MSVSFDMAGRVVLVTGERAVSGTASSRPASKPVRSTSSWSETS